MMQDREHDPYIQTTRSRPRCKARHTHNPHRSWVRTAVTATTPARPRLTTRLRRPTTRGRFLSDGAAPTDGAGAGYPARGGGGSASRGKKRLVGLGVLAGLVLFAVGVVLPVCFLVIKKHNDAGAANAGGSGENWGGGTDVVGAVTGGDGRGRRSCMKICLVDRIYSLTTRNAFFPNPFSSGYDYDNTIFHFTPFPPSLSH
ncbi:hypothetical protein DFH06DRAFT_260403 [Mycena polygramma]|nr:hypothetical protein DFH06DRAFT_260403 [Mycena polygramma]